MTARGLVVFLLHNKGSFIVAYLCRINARLKLPAHDEGGSCMAVQRHCNQKGRISTLPVTRQRLYGLYILLDNLMVQGSVIPTNCHLCRMQPSFPLVISGLHTVKWAFKISPRNGARCCSIPMQFNPRSGYFVPVTETWPISPSCLVVGCNSSIRLTMILMWNCKLQFRLIPFACFFLAAIPKNSGVGWRYSKKIETAGHVCSDSLTAKQLA